MLEASSLRLTMRESLMEQRRVLTLLGWLLFLLAAELFIQRNAVSLWSGERPLHNNDFRHMYVASCLLREGGNFYDAEALRAEAVRQGVERLNPYVYPPLLAILLLPLSLLPFQAAGILWWLVNIALALGAFLLLGDLMETQKKPWNWVLVAFLMATSEPLTRSLTAGQLNLLLLFLLTLCLYLLERDRPIAGGVILGLAAALKVFPALLIAMLFWRRKFRAGWAALGTAAGLTLLSTIIAGWSTSLDYLGVLRQMGYGSSTWSGLGQHYHIAPANQSPAALITRLLTVAPEAGLAGIASMPRLASILSAAAALLLLGASFYVSRPSATAKAPGDSKLCYGLFTLTALLVPSLMWDHYLTIALLPLVLYLNRLNREKPGAVELTFAATAVFLINVPYNFWDPVFTKGWAIALASVKLPGALLLFGLVLRRCRPPGRWSTPGAFS